MIQKIKNYLIVASAALMVAVPAAVPVAVHAQGAGCNSNITQNIAIGASKSSGNNIDCTGTNVGGDSLANLASKIVNLFSIIVGAVAIIMIIYGGFRYITSGGESGRVGNAKNTLIYAIIGLIIVALAQLIVHFVLNQTNNVT
jgi:predicted permease